MTAPTTNTILPTPEEENFSLFLDSIRTIQPQGVNASGIAIISNDRFKHWSVNYTVTSRHFPSPITSNMTLARSIFQSHVASNATMHLVNLVTIPNLETKWQVSYSITPPTVLATANELAQQVKQLSKKIKTTTMTAGNLPNIAPNTVALSHNGRSSITPTTQQKQMKKTSTSRNEQPLKSLKPQNKDKISQSSGKHNHMKKQIISQTPQNSKHGKVLQSQPPITISPRSNNLGEHDPKNQRSFCETPVLSRKFKSHQSRNYFFCRLRHLRKQKKMNYLKPISFVRSETPLIEESKPIITAPNKPIYTNVPPTIQLKYMKELDCFKYAGLDALFALQNISTCSGLSNSFALASTDVLLKIGFIPEHPFNYKEFIQLLLETKGIKSLPDMSLMTSRPIAVNTPTYNHMICSH